MRVELQKYFVGEDGQIIDEPSSDCSMFKGRLPVSGDNKVLVSTACNNFGLISI
jgi:hypothetical protein